MVAEDDPRLKRIRVCAVAEAGTLAIKTTSAKSENNLCIISYFRDAISLTCLPTAMTRNTLFVIL